MLLLWGCLCSMMVYAESKHALLIGISEYQSTDVPLAYTDEEVQLLKQEKYRQGYQKENVQVLFNEQASKHGIVNAWSDMIARLEKGDQVYIHFSGHGGVVKDLNGDEINDSFDEAWVPYDAKKEDGEWVPTSVLIDDEVAELMLQTLKALGRNGHALVTIDSCFSGTSTRSLSIGRSLVPSDVPVDPRPFQLSQWSDPDLASVVVMYASQANEKAAVVSVGQRQMGAFSYALLDTMPRLTEDSTHEDWMADIKSVMDNHPTIKQTPMLEGNGSLPVFNNRLIPEPYARVTAIDGKMVTLETTLFEFQLLGSTVLFQHAKDRTSEPKEVGTGTIVNVDDSTITVELFASLPKGNPKKFAATVQERAYLIGQKEMLLDDSLSAEDRTVISTILKDSTQVVQTESGFGADYLLSKTGAGFVLKHQQLLDLEDSFSSLEAFSKALDNLQLKEFLLMLGAHNNHPDMFSIKATHQGTELNLEEATPLDKGDKVDFTLRSTEPLEVKVLTIDTKGDVCSLSGEAIEMDSKSPITSNLNMEEPSKGIEYVFFIGTEKGASIPFDLDSIKSCEQSDSGSRGVGTASLQRFFDKTDAQTNLLFDGYTILLPYRVVSE